MVLENISKPLSIIEAYILAHSRNLKKMRGWNNDVYDIEFSRSYKAFGINALKALKKDLNPIFIIPRIPIWSMVRKVGRLFGSDFPFDWLPNCINYIIMEKNFTSESLLNRKELYDFCLFEGELLKEESKKWEDFGHSIQKWRKSFDNRSMIIMINSISILKDIVNIVDDIILIQENILNKKYF